MSRAYLPGGVPVEAPVDGVVVTLGVGIGVVVVGVVVVSCLVRVGVMLALTKGSMVG